MHFLAYASGYGGFEIRSNDQGLMTKEIPNPTDEWPGRAGQPKDVRPPHGHY